MVITELLLGEELTYDKKQGQQDMNEAPQTVTASCRQLSSAHCQPETDHASHDNCGSQVDLGKASIHGLTGGQESAKDQAIQRKVSPCFKQSSLSTNLCYLTDHQNCTDRGERQVLAVSKNIYADHMGAGQLSKEQIQAYNGEHPTKEQIQAYNGEHLKENDPGVQSLKMSPASASYDPYNLHDNAYSGIQQGSYNNIDVGPNITTYDYQEKALDLSGRSTSGDREVSCQDNKCQPTSVNNSEAVSLFARSKVAQTATDDVADLSGSTQFNSQQSPISDKSIFRPYSATSHSQNDTLRPLNTLSTQLEPVTRNVPTIHRPIPIYPQPGYPLLSENPNLFHFGARPLQSTIKPSNYQVSNAYTHLLDQLQTSSSLPWSTQGINCTYMPRKIEYDDVAENHFPFYSNDPNKSYMSSSIRHSNQPAESRSARSAKLFPFPNASLPYAANDEAVMLNHMLWVSAFQNSQSQSTSNSEMSFQGEINISDCRHFNYTNNRSCNLMEEFSPYRTKRYTADNVPTAVRSQSWLDSDAQLRDRAFLPVYNCKRKQYTGDNTMRQSGGHEQSVNAIFNEHLQSFSLPLIRNSDGSVPIDLRKDLSQKTNSTNLLYSFGCSKNKSYREDSGTRVNRLADPYTGNEMQQEYEFANVFTRPPQSSHKRKRKLNCIGTDNSGKLARNRNVATLVHVTQANNQSNIRHTQTNIFCPMGGGAYSARNDASIDGPDQQYLCVRGQPCCSNGQECSGSQLKTVEKYLDHDDQRVSVSARPLQCSSATSACSNVKYCDRCAADEPGDPRINTLASAETDGRNYPNGKDHANRHKCFPKAQEPKPKMVLNDSRRQQSSISRLNTFIDCCTGAVCDTTATDQTRPLRKAQRNKRLDGADKLHGKLNDTHTYQFGQSNSVKTKSPAILRKDIQFRNVSEQLRSVVSSNTEEQSRAMFDSCKTNRATISSKQTPAKADYVTPATMQCCNAIATQPYTFRDGKKKSSRDNAAGSKAKLFKCKDCNSSHRSFSALLQHQSRGCQSTISSSTPVHATDCVGSYMRYDTSWVGDKCQCTPCPVCKGIFGSKFRVFSHLQRGCYKEKVLRCTPDLLSTQGCKSEFPEGRITSGKCGLQCCRFRSEAENIDKRVQYDSQSLPSTGSDIKCLHRGTVETAAHIDNGAIQQMPHSKKQHQQTPQLSNNTNPSAPIVNTSLCSNPSQRTLQNSKYPVPHISGHEGTTNIEDSHRYLPANLVIKGCTECTSASTSAPDTELRGPVITHYSNKINELPYLEQGQCRVNQPVVLPGSHKCDKLTGNQETDPTAVPGDTVQSSERDNTRDIKTANTSLVETDTKSGIRDKICISNNTPEIKNGEPDVKQEIDVSAESAAMMDQPETRINHRDLLIEHMLAMANEDVKSKALEDSKGISPVTCNLGICGDVKPHVSTDECSTHKLYRHILGQPVMSLRESLTNDAIQTNAPSPASMPTCPSAASNVISTRWTNQCTKTYAAGSSDVATSLEHDYGSSTDRKQLLIDSCLQPEPALWRRSYERSS